MGGPRYSGGGGGVSSGVGGTRMGVGGTRGESRGSGGQGWGLGGQRQVQAEGPEFLKMVIELKRESFACSERSQKRKIFRRLRRANCFRCCKISMRSFDFRV